MAKLINAQSEESIWAESYDRPIDDLLSIQREVAMSIAELTKTELSPEERHELAVVPTDNIDKFSSIIKIFKLKKYKCLAGMNFSPPHMLHFLQPSLFRKS